MDESHIDALIEEKASYHHDDHYNGVPCFFGYFKADPVRDYIAGATELRPIFEAIGIAKVCRLARREQRTHNQRRGMKKFIFILMLCSSCSDNFCETKPDQALRSKLFQECLKLIPKGPEVVKYNDWDDVVNECGNQAYYQSQRGCGL